MFVPLMCQLAASAMLISTVVEHFVSDQVTVPDALIMGMGV